MKPKRAAKRQSSSPRGFTFTISIVILAITLIAMALFSQEWRKSQRVSFTELMPSEAARIEERVSSDMGAMLGADAHISKTATDVTVGISSKMPFKKEGAPIAEMEGYAASLPSSLKNTGAEAVLSANDITGSFAKVMRISDTGQLLYSNDGANDVITYYHPAGWQPKDITARITCGKEASSVGQFIVPVGGGLHYLLQYDDSGGSVTLGASAASSGNSELTIYYPDQTQMVFKSNIYRNGEGSFTSISYTKSPGGYLILPFDANTSGTVRDYSANNHRLALGSGANAPIWQPSCKNGGCYLFAGNEYINGTALQLTENPIYFAPGSEKVANGGFEAFTGTANDNTTDSWQSWGIQNADPGMVLFLATGDSVIEYAVKIRFGSDESGGDNPMGSNYIYQAVNNLQENSAYMLTFFSKGTGGRYEIYDATASKYLQASGGWGSSEYSFATGAPSSYYGSVTKEFALPMNSSSIQLRLLPSADAGDVYYDEVSLKNSAGMNGGFEYYYKDTGPVGSGWTPEEES